MSNQQTHEKFGAFTLSNSELIAVREVNMSDPYSKMYAYRKYRCAENMHPMSIMHHRPP